MWGLEDWLWGPTVRGFTVDLYGTLVFCFGAGGCWLLWHSFLALQGPGTSSAQKGSVDLPEFYLWRRVWVPQLLLHVEPLTWLCNMGLRWSWHGEWGCLGGFSFHSWDSDQAGFAWILLFGSGFSFSTTYFCPQQGRPMLRYQLWEGQESGTSLWTLTTHRIIKLFWSKKTFKIIVI